MSDSADGRHRFARRDGAARPLQGDSLPLGWDDAAFPSAAPSDAGQASGQAAAARKEDPGDTAAFLNAATLMEAQRAAYSYDRQAVPSSTAPTAGQPSYAASGDTDSFMPVAPTPTPTPAPSHGTAPSHLAPSGASSSDTPANPLVAARAAGVGPSESSPKASPVAPKSADQLYPIAAGPAAGSVPVVAQPGKSFDTSFGEKGGGGRKGLLITLVVIAALAVVAAVAYFVVGGQARSSAEKSIQQAAGHVAEADAVVDPLSQAIASELATSSIDAGLTDAMLTSTTATNALNAAASALDDAERSKALLAAGQHDAIAAARSSVSGRRSILEVGRALLATDTAAGKALQSLQSAYAAIGDAAAKSQSSEQTFAAYVDAVANNADTSGINLAGIVDLDNGAVTDVTNAQAAVAQAKQDYPGADYAGLENYLAARLAELQQLAQYDSLYASGDTDGADAMVDQYNAARDAANQAAASLPADAWSVLSATYAAQVSAQKDAYESAVRTCDEGDAALATYLGTGEVGGLSSSASSGADLSASSETPAAAAPTSEQAPAA